MLLGARQFFERRGTPTPSVPTARDYVQTGLVAMWDGIENAGWGVHDAAATTWKDLIGGIDVSVVGGSLSQSTNYWIADAYKVVDGTSSNYQMEGVVGDSYSLLNADKMTYQLVMRNLTKENGGIFGFRNSVRNGMSMMALNSFNIWFTFRNAWNTNNIISFSIGNLDTSSVCIYGVLNGAGTKADVYVAWGDGSGIVHSVGSNDQAALSADVTMSQQTILSLMGYFRNVWPNRCLTAEMCGFRIYSRALTAAEIANNYAIDKARFNLP